MRLLSTFCLQEEKEGPIFANDYYQHELDLNALSDISSNPKL